jgi:predicted  nucleic acid-binding Zn-ribbon protein
MSKRALDIHLRRLETALAKQEESLTQLKARNRERETQFEKNLASCRAKIEEVRVAADEYKDTIDREAKRRERELLREIERLKKLGGLASVEPENFEGLEKAKTVWYRKLVSRWSNSFRHHNGFAISPISHCV